MAFLFFIMHYFHLLSHSLNTVSVSALVLMSVSVWCHGASLVLCFLYFNSLALSHVKKYSIFYLTTRNCLLWLYSNYKSWSIINRNCYVDSDLCSNCYASHVLCSICYASHVLCSICYASHVLCSIRYTIWRWPLLFIIIIIICCASHVLCSICSASHIMCSNQYVGHVLCSIHYASHVLCSNHYTGHV